MFNEFTILIACYVTFLCLNVTIATESRFIFGWVLIGFASLNIVGNMCLMVLNTVLDTFETVKSIIFKRRAKKEFREKLDRKTLVTENFEFLDLKNFKYEKEFYDAV